MVGKLRFGIVELNWDLWMELWGLYGFNGIGVLFRNIFLCSCRSVCDVVGWL